MFASHSRLSMAAAFLAAGLLAAADVARAGDWDWNPSFHGELEVETPFTYTFDPDSRLPDGNAQRSKDNHLSNFYTECDDCILRFGLTPALNIVANIGLGPLQEEKEFENVRYDSMIVFAKEFYVSFASNRLFETRKIDEVGLFGGKFNPDFGLQNGGLREENEFPGIFSEEYIEDYELEEMIGVGGDITLDLRKAGSHTLTASAFYRDDSFLTKTLFSDRPRNRRRFGGPANTGTPNSFSVTLLGEDIVYLPGLRYEFGFSRLHKGHSGGLNNQGFMVGWEGEGEQGGRPTKAQTAWAAALVYNKVFFLPRPTFRHPLDLKFMFEYANIRHFGGFNDAFEQDRAYYTPSLRLRYGPWNLSFIYSRREIDLPGEFTDAERESLEDDAMIEVETYKDYGDDMYEVNFGYWFDTRWYLSASWARMEEFEEGRGHENHLFGIQLDYRLLF